MNKKKIKELNAESYIAMMGHSRQPLNQKKKTTETNKCYKC